MKYYLTSIFIGILLSSASVAQACSVPKLGGGFSTSELIENSSLIVIAEVAFINKGDLVDTYTFKVIETLKGTYQGNIEFQTSPFSNSEYQSNDFNAHSTFAWRFWLLGDGRSLFPCCVCGPLHTFRIGDQYLLFPELFGAKKSAEIINSPDDNWLKYVRWKISRNL